MEGQQKGSAIRTRSSLRPAAGHSRAPPSSGPDGERPGQTASKDRLCCSVKNTAFHLENRTSSVSVSHSELQQSGGTSFESLRDPRANTQLSTSQRVVAVFLLSRIQGRTRSCWCSRENLRRSSPSRSGRPSACHGTPSTSRSARLARRARLRRLPCPPPSVPRTPPTCAFGSR